MTVPLKINAYKKTFKCFVGKKLKTIQLRQVFKDQVVV